MSLDQPQKNKMVQAPSAKKGFHFAGDGVRPAMYIEAETIEEANAIYAKQTTAQAERQSTASTETAEKKTVE